MTRSSAAAKARRPRGEGALFQLADGRWQARMWVDGHRLKRTRTTQREGLGALDELRRLAGSGMPYTRHTVGDMLDSFLAHGQASRGWAPSTVRSYRSAIEVHLRPNLGARLLRELGVGDVQRLVDSMLAAGHAGRHVAHVRGVLRAALAPYAA